MRTPAMLALATGLAITAAQAQVLRRVLDFPMESTGNVAIDDAGTVVYAVSTTNQFGTNPGHLRQIIRWDPVTGVGAQLTDFEEGVEWVSVSDDGTWLAFVTRADLLGTNHDESAELYVMQSNGSGLTQLTSENVPLLVDRGVLAAVISGSANRVAFVGKINPLGTNPTYLSALFVIDLNGANLRQLGLGVAPTPIQESPPSIYRPGPGFDISDDGARLAYVTGGREIARINANGSGGLTFPGTTNAADVAISGNGVRIAFTFGPPGARNVRIRTYDGTMSFAVGAGEVPRITDDGTSVYMARYAAEPVVGGLWRMPATGGAGATLISADTQPAALSGSGNRVVARGSEILAMDNAGANVQQLTTTTLATGAYEFTMSSDASTIHFVSNMDPLGTNPTHDYEYFSYELATGQFWQRTGAGPPEYYWLTVISPDDGSVFFASDSDPAGQNPCGDYQLFRLHPGGTYTQLTACGEQMPSNRRWFSVHPNGEVVAFLAYVGNDIELVSVHGDGSSRTSLAGSAYITYPGSMSVAGTGPETWVAYTAGNSTLADGGVFRVKADGTALQRLTPWFDDYFPSISADGSVVAWWSEANYGSNPDQSHEVFVFDDATQTIQQITNNELFSFYPLVTQDGQWVFSGLRRFHVPSNTPQFLVAHGIPDATGSRWLVVADDFTVTRHLFGAAPDGLSIFLADANATPSFVVGKDSPTVLSWDFSPFSLRFDVIRGSVANLAIAGNAVSLGPVTCVENDSPDNHTRGHGDPADPAPGEAFFYLFSGNVGSTATAGSYGQGSGGRERVAGAGGCAP